MNQQIERSNDILAAVAGAMAALAEGKLSDYAPLEAAIGTTQETPMMSWGPMMKK